MLEIEDHNWETVNLKAPMLLMKYVPRHLIDRGDGGRVINLGSSSAFRARNSPMGYATSKAAIVQLTRSAAAELGRYALLFENTCAPTANSRLRV